MPDRVDTPPGLPGMTPASGPAQTGPTRLFRTLVGDPADNSMERRLFNAISLLNGVVNIVGSSVYLVSSQTWLFLIQLASGILFLVFYYFSRHRGTWKSLYWPFVALMLVFLFDNSLRNGGTLGGSHYYLIVGLVVATALSDKAAKTILAAILFGATTGLLLLIESYYPQWITAHEGSHERLVDVAGNFLFAADIHGRRGVALV